MNGSIIVMSHRSWHSSRLLIVMNIHEGEAKIRKAMLGNGYIDSTTIRPRAPPFSSMLVSEIAALLMPRVVLQL